MRFKNKRITYFNFLPYECAAAEEYLQTMAEKGWMLSSINGAYLSFKKIEPKKIKYSVDVLHKVSVFDSKVFPVFKVTILFSATYACDVGSTLPPENGTVKLNHIEHCF